MQMASFMYHANPVCQPVYWRMLRTWFSLLFVQIVLLYPLVRIKIASSGSEEDIGPWKLESRLKGVGDSYMFGYVLTHYQVRTSTDVFRIVFCVFMSVLSLVSIEFKL